MKQEYLPRLDGLRGIAALGVVILHLGMIRSIGPDPFAEFPIPEWIENDAWMLVDLFFVLSGYIFAHCYLQDGKMKEGVTTASFTVARFARLWPLSIVTLAMCAWLLRDASTTNLTNILLSASFLHILTDPFSLNVPAWSISVEVICYLIFMIAALSGRRMLTTVTLICIVAGAWIILQDIHEGIGRGLIGFFVGQMLKRYENFIPVWAAMPFAFIPFAGSGGPEHLVVNAIIGWPAVIILAKRLPLLETRPLAWLGSRSYSIYMIHVPVMYYHRQMSPLLGKPQEHDIAILVVSAILITLWGADLLYRAVENPSRKRIMDIYQNVARQRSNPSPAMTGSHPA